MNGTALLEIRNLRVRIEGQEILKGITLTVRAGEVHSIMGPNGSGKSTLAQVLAGREVYEIVEGEVLYEGEDLLRMSPEERARRGIFLAFQYPVEIPGVSNLYFLKAAVNAVRKSRGLARTGCHGIPRSGPRAGEARRIGREPAPARGERWLLRG